MKKILLLVFVLLCANAYSQKYTQAQIDSIVKLSSAAEEIPPTFIGQGSILVVFMDSRKNINKYLKKELEKQYKGEYRLLEQGEALDKSDTSKTRFFVTIREGYNSAWGSGSTRVSAETFYQMIMVDRLTKKTYTYKTATSCYSCLFEEYFKKLEKLRSQTK
jgi:hypothetical protein